MDDARRLGDYDDPSATRMLGIAADVLRSFGSGFGGQHLAIIGGLVPSLLVPKAPVGIDPHVGTADLDLHLSLQLLAGETADYYGSIIDGLRSLGLRQDDEGERRRLWRWIGPYRDIALRVELLCPSTDRPAVPTTPTSGTAAELNIGLTRLVSDQFQDTRSVGPRAYADFFGSPDDIALMRHAQSAVAELGRELRWS